MNTKSYGSELPPGAGEELLKSPIFFDVSIEGVSKGKVAVYITHDKVTDKHRMHHWDGSKWFDHKEKVVSGNTIRADFNITDLHGTPIVIGTMRTNPQTPIVIGTMRTNPQT